jgi:hypothetical protein
MQAFEERRGLLVELPAHSGEADFRTRLLEQADAEFVLKIAHLLEHRRLVSTRRRIAAGGRHPAGALEARDLHR